MLNTKQVAQFGFRPEEVLQGVFIELLKKSVNSFSDCRAQCATGCDPAVALRILAFNHREVRLDFADDCPHHNLAWRLS